MCTESKSVWAIIRICFFKKTLRQTKILVFFTWQLRKVPPSPKQKDTKKPSIAKKEGFFAKKVLKLSLFERDICYRITNYFK